LSSAAGQAQPEPAHVCYGLTGNLFHILAEQSRLQRENVVQHAFDPPAFEAMVRDQPAGTQDMAKPVGKWSIDPALTLGESILQDLEALVEAPHARPFGSGAKGRHVPKTSSRPPATTLTRTLGSVGGGGYLSLSGWPSSVKARL
jgi:hypothetical protein